MKTRSCLVLLFLLFLAITLGLSVFVVISTAQKAPPAAISTPVANSTPTTTPTPMATATSAPTLKNTITNVEGTIFDPIVAFLDFLAAVSITALVVVVVKLVWDYSGKTNLVVDAFTNATGDDALDKVLPGLNQRTRMQLAEALERVRKDINTYNEVGLEQPGKSPPPSSTSNQQLNSLMRSLTDISSGSVKTAVQLLSLVFGPSGTEIVTTLHCPGHSTEIGALRMGVEIMDLQGRKEPLSMLFREPKGDNSSQPKPDPAGNWHLPQEILNLLPWHQKPKPSAEPEKTLEERYLSILRPVAYWLSIELVMRSMEDARGTIRRSLRLFWKAITFQYVIRYIKKSGEWKTNYRAKLYNYIGYFHLNNAQDFSRYGYAYRLAIETFNKAITFDKNWFLPYQNLGETYLIIAQGKVKQARQGTEPLQLTEDGIDDIYQALSYLRIAEKLFQDNRKKQRISRERLDGVERFLNLFIAITRLLSGDAMLVAESIEHILANRTWETDNLDKKIDFRLFYNLACWYGIAHSVNLPTRDTSLADVQQRARHIIVCSLARNAEFWFSASRDPSLVDIATKEEWSRLKRLLERKQSNNPYLSKSEGNAFANDINDILHQLNW